MKKRIHIHIAAACAAFCFCSCSWHIGDRIRESCVTHTGVDSTRPVDGKVYTTETTTLTLNPKSRDYYVLAPEVTYKKVSPLLAPGASWFYGYKQYDRDVRPTGNYRWIRLLQGCDTEVTSTNYARVLSHGGGLRVVDSLPKGTRLQYVVHPDIKTPKLLRESSKKSAGYNVAAAVAAPFDYVVDPVLSVASTGVYLVGCGIYGIFRYPIAQLAK